MDTARFARRALLRASMSAAGSTFAAALARRPHPTVAAAAGVAATAGAAMELPVMAVPFGVASLWLVRRARNRGDAVAPLLATAVGGAFAAAATTRTWPRAPRTAADIRPALVDAGSHPTEDGAGLSIVVNASAGPALRQAPSEQLADALPAAKLLEVGEHLDLADALKTAGESALALGVAGGDGSIGAAAAVAHAVDKPLLVVPAGTLNHLARDLGIGSIGDSIEALRAGHTVAVDVATIDGRVFLNTASFGGYSELVDSRERLEGTIGKWPALFVALWQVLRRSEPVRVEIDGRPRSLWMIFIGNCRYHPAGFAPSWRERLNDGELDIRLVDASEDWARVRLLLAVLTGRLGRCRIYEGFTTKRLEVRSLQGPLRLARDGETFDGSESFVIAKDPKPLEIYVPPADRASQP